MNNVNHNLSEVARALDNYNLDDVELYCSYCNTLATTLKRGQLANPWFLRLPTAALVDNYKSVAKDGLVIDGKDVTIISTGISYNYQAYKNKMLIAYPESVIDTELTYKGDDFNFSKASGKIEYTHTINRPFGRKDVDIIGGYCIIKNKRGEFLTLLSREAFMKHRAVAKTKYIWDAWFPEMCMKTLIKKSTSKHFRDTFKNMETIDNQNYDPDKASDFIAKTNGTAEKPKDLMKSSMQAAPKPPPPAKKAVPKPVRPMEPLALKKYIAGKATKAVGKPTEAQLAEVTSDLEVLTVGNVERIFKVLDFLFEGVDGIDALVSWQCSILHKWINLGELDGQKIPDDSAIKETDLILAHLDSQNTEGQTDMFGSEPKKSKTKHTYGVD